MTTTTARGEYTAGLSDKQCRWALAERSRTGGITEPWGRFIDWDVIEDRRRAAFDSGQVWPTRWRQPRDRDVLPWEWIRAHRDAQDLDTDRNGKRRQRMAEVVAAHALAARARTVTDSSGRVGTVTFSERVLAGDWGVNRETLRKGIAELESSGWIRREGGRHRRQATVYTLTIPPEAVPTMPAVSDGGRPLAATVVGYADEDPF